MYVAKAQNPLRGEAWSLHQGQPLRALRFDRPSRSAFPLIEDPPAYLFAFPIRQAFCWGLRWEDSTEKFLRPSSERRLFPEDMLSSARQRSLQV